MKSQSGFGIAQVLIALGIMGGVSVVIMKSFENSSMVAKSNDFRHEVSDYSSQIYRVLSSKTACVNSFNMMNATDTDNINSIKNDKNIEVFNKNTVFGTMNVRFDSMKLEDVMGIKDGVNVVPGNMGSTNLVIRYSPKKSTLMKSRQVIEKIKLWIMTDSSSRITSCYAASTGEDLIWSREAANPDNIYYNSGNVGVGLDAPTEKLDVAGWVQAQNGAGDKIAIGGDATNYQIKVDKDKPIVFKNEATGTNANIEAKNVVAKGHVQLAPSASPCKPENSGAIRYNAALKRVQVCDGTHWLTKAIVTWCLPPNEIKKGDDEWMLFHQADDARREKGTGCSPSQVRRKKHANMDSSGFKIKYDDTSKSCDSNENCTDWKASEQ